jgi:hypothetical protein
MWQSGERSQLLYQPHRFAGRLAHRRSTEERNRRGPQSKVAGILGKVAIANGKLTYEAYRRIFSSPRWKALAAKGAQTQRVLWASTSTKNPNYRDVIYIEELIGPDTVNTVPPATLDAFRDHGKPRASLTEDLDSARQTMADLASVGIVMKDVGARMQLGMVGLGRMGANMTRRLMRGGHTMVVSDLSADAVKGLAGEGAVASSSLDDLVGKLTPPRCVDHGALRRSHGKNRAGIAREACRRATPSSTAATRISKTTFAAPRSAPPKACTTSTSAPAAASGDSSAATA